MNYKTMMITLALSTALLCTGNVNAQNSNDMTKAQLHVKDSAEAASVKEAQVEQTKDDNRMADAKLDKKQARANAKNARRIENDANTAARESQYAVSSERRAQKARKQANKQAKKASAAMEKADSN